MITYVSRELYIYLSIRTIYTTSGQHVSNYNLQTNGEFVLV
jgi:hypothetical protein